MQVMSSVTDTPQTLSEVIDRIERIREELVRIFLDPHRVRGLDLLDASGLLAQLIPEMMALKGCEQPPLYL